ncbi:hypothetical protein Tco_1407058 [Tanacetum coccineum]
MEDDDDDISDLDDYLIPNDASCYVDEEEERFKERRSKLLGIPYKNHQRSNLKNSSTSFAAEGDVSMNKSTDQD